MKKRVAIVGASGRMGRELLSELSVEGAGARDKYDLSAALVSAGSASKGCSTGVASVEFQAYAQELLKSAECVIDFSNPAQAGKVAMDCATLGLPLLIGTTGIEAHVLQVIESAAQDVQILLAPNTSLGIAALSELASLAQKVLGPGFDVELSEIHHRLKKDAPSGTAKALASRLSSEGDLKQVYGREGLRSERELGIVSLRGGGVYGEHTVHFFGNGERIQLTHQAESRAIFARGAYSLMDALLKQPPGLYSVPDLIAQHAVY